MKVGIFNLGINNISSLFNSFSKYHKTYIINKKNDIISKTELYIVPGTGSFKSGMDAIKNLDFLNTIEEISIKSKVLGICLGMQLFLNSSKESPQSHGLSLIDGKLIDIKSKFIKKNNLGWYKISSTNKLLNQKIFYFNHSFCAKLKKKNVFANIKSTDIIAAIKFRNIVGLQFHPEKSSTDGLNLIKNINKLWI
jgi:glutamine amidotransferase